MNTLLANITTTLLTNSSSSSSSSSPLISDDAPTANKKEWFGFLGCLICVLGFGSSYVPVKKYVTGDGFYYQMFLGLGVWVVGLVVNNIQGFPKMEGIVLLGGAIWSVGNFLAVYTIQLLGMALGIPLYNVFLLIVGWSTGTFGLGIKKNKVSMPVLNYIGLVVAIVAVILYIFVNSATEDSSSKGGNPADVEECSTPTPLRGNCDFNDDDEDGIEIVDLSRTPSSSDSGGSGGDDNSDESDDSKEHNHKKKKSSKKVIDENNDSKVNNHHKNHKNHKKDKKHKKHHHDKNEENTNTNDKNIDDESALRAEEEALHSPLSDFIQNLSPKKKKVWGVIIAIITGVCFSVNFIPAQHLIDYDDNCSNDQLDYVFIHFTGLLMTTLVAFIVYCICMKNRPIVYPRLALPAFISGVLVGLAQVGWYIGNKNLSFNITFPINTSGPSVVASLWGIIVFREIKGKKQLTLVSVAIIVSVLGVIFITLSKFL